MDWTTEEVESHLERWGVPPTVSLTGLARLTGIDARTLGPKVRKGHLGKIVKGPRKGLYVERVSAAEYFAGAGEPIWSAAFSRHLPPLTYVSNTDQPDIVEEWRRADPRDFPSEKQPHVLLVEVSTWGRVRTAVNRRGSARGRVLKARESAGGYFDVYLTLPPSEQEKRHAKDEGRRPHYRGKNLPIHRLVASAWCDHREGATEVHHRDGNRANNTAKNLMWATRKENAEFARQHGGVGRSGGRPSAKLEPEEIADILTRQLTAEGYSRKYNISVRQVYRIWAGEQWKRMQPAG